MNYTTALNSVADMDSFQTCVVRCRKKMVWLFCRTKESCEKIMALVKIGERGLRNANSALHVWLGKVSNCAHQCSTLKYTLIHSNLNCNTWTCDMRRLCDMSSAKLAQDFASESTILHPSIHVLNWRNADITAALLPFHSCIHTRWCI